jgi:hypothetical protein
LCVSLGDARHRQQPRQHVEGPIRFHLLSNLYAPARKPKAAGRRDSV